jgi:hypothetical protein
VLADFLSREQGDLNEGQTWLWEAWMSVGAMEQEVSGLQQPHQSVTATLKPAVTMRDTVVGPSESGRIGADGRYEMRGARISIRVLIP